MNSAHTSGQDEERPTPGTDMQPEDAGTPASGNAKRGTAAEDAMKQTSKTDAERAGRPTRGDAGEASR